MSDTAADEGAEILAEQVAKPLVRSQDATLTIVNKNRIADGIECVGPLFLNGRELLKQTNVLQGQTKQIADVHQVGDFVWLEMFRASAADADDAQRSGLATEHHGDHLGNARFRDARPRLGIGLRIQTQKIAGTFLK